MITPAEGEEEEEEEEEEGLAVLPAPAAMVRTGADTAESLTSALS